MMGSLANAFSTLILAIAVNRINGESDGGLFSFAYSNAQLMLTIGILEARPYQSTDINEKYSFSVYMVLRRFSCIVMIAFSMLYAIVGGFDIKKAAAIVIFTVFKSVEAYTDVYAGRYQQKDRIDIGGKIFFVRVVVSTIMFIATLIISRNLIIAALSMMLSSVLLFFVNDRRYIFEQDKKIEKVEFAKVKKLFIEIVPLAIGAFILMYISNAPKYAINAYYDDKIQNIYNILFMPAFVINMFSLFFFRPMLVEMTSNWNKNNISGFVKMMVKTLLYILGVTFVCEVGTYLLGIPILSLLYNVDLATYKMDLLLVMCVGGISALMTYFSYVIVVIRKQKYILMIDVIVFVYTFFTSKLLVKNMEIRGGIYSYGSSILALVVMFFVLITVTVLRKRKTKEKN